MQFGWLLCGYCPFGCNLCVFSVILCNFDLNHICDFSVLFFTNPLPSLLYSLFFCRFVEQFTKTELLDEKARSVESFLSSMSLLLRDEFNKTSSSSINSYASNNPSSNDPSFPSTTSAPDHVTLLEKYFMSRIYSSAFHPNGALDQGRDLVMLKHVTSIAHVVTPDHVSLQINPRFVGQAPWMLAQRELLKVNVFKAPGDKMGCIVAACKTIMSTYGDKWVVWEEDSVGNMMVEYGLWRVSVGMMI